MRISRPNNSPEPPAIGAVSPSRPAGRLTVWAARPAVAGFCRLASDRLIKCHLNQTMKVPIKSIAVTLILISFLWSTVRAEILTIESTNATPTWCSPLVTGTPYFIQASGWFYFAYSPEIPDLRENDANYFFLNNGNSVQVQYAPLRIDSQVVSWLGTVDGSIFAVDTYSPSHIYNYYLIGDGLAHGFVIADVFYPDNFGSLQVSILPIPIPTLNITPSGTNCLLSWPSTAAGFNLYQNTDLLSTNWLLVTNQPNVSGGTNTILISGTSTGTEFFKLKFP
jgi:hypothetical protein